MSYEDSPDYGSKGKWGFWFWLSFVVVMIGLPSACLALQM
jgi:hypothetical protein